jgi:hypothetical protein
MKFLKGRLTLVSPHAFTMVEVAVALAITAIGVIGVIGILPQMLKTGREAVNSTEIALAVQDYIEYDYSSNLTPTDIASRYPDNGTNSVLVTNISFSADCFVRYDNSKHSLSGLEFTEDGGVNPILIKQSITYKWPAGKTNQSSYTFITEIVATTNIAMVP